MRPSVKNPLSLLQARRQELDRIVVWRLDRWGQSLVDVVTTLLELASLSVGFVSPSEALDLTTPSGQALAGMLAVFAEFDVTSCVIGSKPASLRRARKAGHTGDHRV